MSTLLDSEMSNSGAHLGESSALLLAGGLADNLCLAVLPLARAAGRAGVVG